MKGEKIKVSKSNNKLNIENANAYKKPVNEKEEVINYEKKRKVISIKKYKNGAIKRRLKLIEKK